MEKVLKIIKHIIEIKKIEKLYQYFLGGSFSFLISLFLSPSVCRFTSTAVAAYDGYTGLTIPVIMIQSVHVIHGCIIRGALSGPKIYTCAQTSTEKGSKMKSLSI